MIQHELVAAMFSRGNAGERPGNEVGERRPPTFFTMGTASPLPKSNVGERRSPWQGLNMIEVQWTLFDTIQINVDILQNVIVSLF
jgi:hypothetical protein